MNRSSNELDGSTAFHLVTKKTEDGKTTVSCPAQPQIPPVTHERFSTALEGMKQRLQKAEATGKLK